jgi:hypothetical protein
MKQPPKHPTIKQTRPNKSRPQPLNRLPTVGRVYMLVGGHLLRHQGQFKFTKPSLGIVPLPCGGYHASPREVLYEIDESRLDMLRYRIEELKARGLNPEEELFIIDELEREPKGRSA